MADRQTDRQQALAAWLDGCFVAASAGSAPGGGGGADDEPAWRKEKKLPPHENLKNSYLASWQTWYFGPMAFALAYFQRTERHC